MHKRSGAVVSGPRYGKENMGLGGTGSQEVAEDLKSCHFGTCLRQAFRILLGMFWLGWAAVPHLSIKYLLRKQAGPDVRFMWAFER